MLLIAFKEFKDFEAEQQNTIIEDNSANQINTEPFPLHGPVSLVLKSFK
jgi:hypothetical protein